MLTQFLPDSNCSDNKISYQSVMSVALLLCKGEIYEKAMVLYSLISLAPTTGGGDLADDIQIYQND